KAWEILTLDNPDANVISLDRLSARPLISCTFQTLDTRAQILAAARDPGLPNAIRERIVYAPVNSPVGECLTGIDRGTLRVPDDDRWKRAYLEFHFQSDFWFDRMISRRKELKCPQTIDLLKH